MMLIRVNRRTLHHHILKLRPNLIHFILNLRLNLIHLNLKNPILNLKKPETFHHKKCSIERLSACTTAQSPARTSRRHGVIFAKNTTQTTSHNSALNLAQLQKKR